MKTSTIVLIGAGGVAALAAYLYFKNRNNQPAVQNAVVVETVKAPVLDTQPIIRQQPQPLVFVPIIKDPGIRPAVEDQVITVSAQPTSQPVYVAPVKNPTPILVTPVEVYARPTVKGSVMVSGYSLI